MEKIKIDSGIKNETVIKIDERVRSTFYLRAIIIMIKSIRMVICL